MDSRALCVYFSLPNAGSQGERPAARSCSRRELGPAAAPERWQHPAHRTFVAIDYATKRNRCTIVANDSAEYVAHAEHKKVPVAALQKLFDQGRPMHLIRIAPVRMDVLFSGFKKLGYDARQVLDYADREPGLQAHCAEVGKRKTADNS